MIKYNISTKNSDNIKLSKEKLLKRKEALIKFNKKVKEQIEINDERENISLEYIKNHYSD